MLPETLIMQAFGPYVEQQRIDFSIFPHLFLIRGETGSGKTMILDAITYALYGKSSGGQREDFESMRSRFAKEELPTLVDFSFQLHEHHYRFMRKVEVRKKRNKEKAIKVSIDAGEIINGQFYPFFENPKLKNVEEKAVSLIGLTHEQFIQVMILPQGKFEQLLISKSEEKQDILRTLFQMEKWEAISANLNQKANEMRKDMEYRKQRIDALLESIHVSGKEEITLLCIDIEKKKEQKSKELLELEEQLKQSQDIINQQRTIQKLLVEQKELQKKEEALHQKEAIIKQREAILTVYHEVEKILPYYQSNRQYQSALKKRTQEYEEAIKQEAMILKKAEQLGSMMKQLEELRQNMPEHLKKENRLTSCMDLFQRKEEQKKLLETAMIQQQKIQIKLEQQNNHVMQLDKHHSVLYEAYLKDTAMQLRDVLQDHEPCPVCGSLHHPYTEVAQKQYIDVLTLKKVKEELEQAKEASAKFQLLLAKVEADVTHHTQQTERIQMEYRDNYSDYQDYDSLEALENFHQKIQQDIVDNTKQTQQLEADIQTIQKAKEQSLLSVETKKREVQLAQENADRALKEYETHNQQKFEEEILKHQPDAAIIEAYRIEQEDHKTALIQVSTRSKEVKKLLEQEEVQELSTLLQNLKIQEAKQKMLLSELAELNSRKKQLTQVKKRSESMLMEYEELQPKYQKLLHFSKAMRGDNSVGIERYVLGIMLSNITQNANQLLQGVHHGRYQIYRSEHASGKTRKFGLEFSIYDAYTCSMRSVVSLSGGEKFLVSLALSLALSISVQARNGGISFDCMFIDEGFGTLDEHSIADALTILEKMSKQKGTIGIISHVEALKEYIPDGIEVEKTRNGSTISMRRD